MDEADSYVGKWLARQPEMELALLFCQASQRRVTRLWGALLLEVDAAVYEVSEVSVAHAKLAWWGEELVRGTTGCARHPLLHAFFAEPLAQQVPAACWTALVRCAMQLAADEARASDVSGLIAIQRPYARALAQIESALFGGGDASETIAAERVLWSLRSSTLRWPLPLLARHQVEADALAQGPLSPAAQRLVADLAAGLLARLPEDAGGMFRRMRNALLRRQLGALAQERDPRIAPIRLPWLFWRAARAAARDLA